MVNDDGGKCYMCYEDMSVNELKKERKELKIKELRKRYKLEGVLE